MRRLLTGYAVHFNRRHRRHGPLFQNRYKSILCQQEPYLLELVRYIHLNPLRAKLVLYYKNLKRFFDGKRPKLVGGGLIRSLGGWASAKTSRGKKGRIKGDERILGDGHFVQEVLESCQEQLERRYHYQAKGYDFDWGAQQS